MTDELVFRGLRGRSFEDQARAMANGYQSVNEMAIDELGQMLLELIKRVEQLEKPVQFIDRGLSLRDVGVE